MKKTYEDCLTAMVRKTPLVTRKEKPYQGATQGGMFQDEVSPWPFKNADGTTETGSVWFYHGHPIVASAHGKMYFSSAGYRTRTTKDRLNAAGAGISQRKGEWWIGDLPFEDADMGTLLGVKTYHRIDGWRGYGIPALAVAGCSNTGGWSDSPARPEEGQGEMGTLRRVLKSHGIKSYFGWTATSNVFCIKTWVLVRGKDYQKALPLVDSFFDAMEGKIHLLHGVG